MAAPVFVQSNPANLAANADIGSVSVDWTASGPDDPLDIALFTIARDGVGYPTAYLALGGLDFRAIADVGLFPDDHSVMITATAQSQAGFVSTETFSFDCRGPLAMAQVRAIDAAAQPLTAPRGGLMQLAIVPAYGVASARAALVPRSPVAAIPSVASFRAVLFKGGSDIQLAHISATRQIRIALALIGNGVSVPMPTEPPSQAEDVTGAAWRADYQHAPVSVITNYVQAVRFFYGLEVGKPQAVVVLIAEGAGREAAIVVAEAAQVRQGDGLLAALDAIDASLDDVR